MVFLLPGLARNLKWLFSFLVARLLAKSQRDVITLNAVTWIDLEFEIRRDQSVIHIINDDNFSTHQCSR